MMNQMIMQKISQEQPSQLHSIQLFNTSMRTIIEHRLINIEQRVQQLIKFNCVINDKDFF
jgi:hypothetical protein